MENVTAEIIEKNINLITKDLSFTENIQKSSQIFQTAPMNQVQTEIIRLNMSLNMSFTMLFFWYTWLPILAGWRAGLFITDLYCHFTCLYMYLFVV